MAQWHATGKLKIGEDFIHESYIGSQFIGRIEAGDYHLLDKTGNSTKYSGLGQRFMGIIQ